MSTKVDLDMVERNLHSWNYLNEQLKPALLDAIARIRELEAALTKEANSLLECYVGEDPEERADMIDMAGRMTEIVAKGLVLT